jgi:myo-inositol 2-dehydrogenase/D-chiro-inositol 1-dehydrogenase
MSEVRFGLAGYGAWGRHHGRAIAKTPGARLVATAARSEASRASARSDHPGCAVYADYNEMLRRDDLDVIDVVVPNHLHVEVGLAALESGRHLLLEKPMAPTVEECRRLVTAAEGRRRLLAIGFEMRVSELWGKVAAMIAAGEIGEPLYVTIDLARRPYRPGSEEWRFDIRRVGSWILEEPIHFFDLACWYFGGCGKPVSVYAAASSKQPGHPELHDNFSCLVRFDHGGHAVVNQTLAAFGHHQDVKVTGRKGALWARWSGAMDRDPNPTSSLRHFDGRDVREVPLSAPAGELYELEGEIAMMVRAVRDGAPPAASGPDGLRAVRLCEAAQASIERGGVVALADARGET